MDLLTRAHGSRFLGIPVSATLAVAIVLIVLSPAGAVGWVRGSTSPDGSNISVQGAMTGPQEWPTYLGNDLRTSNNTTETWLNKADASKLAVNWTFATSGPVASSTTVFDGVAYFGSWDGYEYAVNVKTGQLLWKTFLGVDSYDPKCYGGFPIGISSAPTVSNGTLYLGGNNATGGFDASWYALSASSGAILWSVTIGNMSQGYYNWASPLIYDGFAYVGIASSCDQPLVPAGLLQVNLTSHSIENFFHTTPINKKTGKYLNGASIWGSPSVDPRMGVVFAATGNPPGVISSEPYSDAILAFNATNITRNQKGQPGLDASWQIPAAQAVTDGDFGVGPTVLQGQGPKGTDLVVAGNKNGYIYGLNASNLSSWTVSGGHLGTLWETHVPMTIQEIISPGSFGGGLVYFTTPAVNISGKITDGSVWAIKPKTGVVAWNCTLSGRGIGAPLYANGLLMVAAGQFLWEYNATTGSKIHEWKYSGDFVSAISIAEGRIFVGNENNNVYALCVPSVSCSTTPQP